ncbi:hypothetical protein DFP73DRAFT_540354 [Morchella snyderi]|nr:hypothetical protein DFP73DRAFT_540354 [Morchella snyderi]
MTEGGARVSDRCWIGVRASHLFAIISLAMMNPEQNKRTKELMMTMTMAMAMAMAMGMMMMMMIIRWGRVWDGVNCH